MVDKAKKWPGLCQFRILVCESVLRSNMTTENFTTAVLFKRNKPGAEVGEPKFLANLTYIVNCRQPRLHAETLPQK